MIFSRVRGAAGRRGDGSREGKRPRKGRHDSAVELDLEVADARQLPEFGPYDSAAAPDDERQRIDLGALRIPAVEDVEIHLQAGPQGHVERVLLAHQNSRLQLGVFAAPRTEGIWDEVRETLRSSLAAGGAKPVEISGEYGVELRATVKDGGGLTDVRHVGIDGPRWFVHGIYVGSAASDPDKAGPLREVLRGVVVDRGIDAMPVSEALPLRLPPEAAAQLASAMDADHQES